MFTRGLSVKHHALPVCSSPRLPEALLPSRFAGGSDPASPLEPTVAITFDDGFRSVYEHAWPLLRERGLWATCYLVTDVIDNKALIWLNELNWFLHRHGPVARPIISEWLGLGRARPIAVLIRTSRRALRSARSREACSPRSGRRPVRIPRSSPGRHGCTSTGTRLPRWPPLGCPSATTPARTRRSRTCRWSRAVRRSAVPRHVLSHLPGAGQHACLSVRQPD